MTRWSGLFRDSKDQNEPYDGVPTWMAQPLQIWLNRAFKMVLFDGTLKRDFRKIEKFDMQMRNLEPLAALARESSFETVLHTRSEDELLELTDFALAQIPVIERTKSEEVQTLEKILEDSGSAWTVGTRAGFLGLVRRVSGPEMDLLTAAVTPKDTASDLLAEAWSALYGLHPNPELAHSQAIKAVEEVLLPIVIPKNKVATIGQAKAHLRQGGKPVPSWDADGEVLTKELLPLLERITRQGSRHGANGYQKPKVVETEIVLFYSILVVAVIRRLGS